MLYPGDYEAVELPGLCSNIIFGIIKNDRPGNPVLHFLSYVQIEFSGLPTNPMARSSRI
jgi:hypothetical protein